MTKRLFAIAAVLGIIGCGGKDTSFSGILTTEKMQAVMWDIIQADVFTDQFLKKDLSKKTAENIRLQNEIFAIHKVTKDQYYKSYDYYVYHAELLKLILDSISSKADRDRIKMLQRHAGASPKQLQ